MECKCRHALKRTSRPNENDNNHEESVNGKMDDRCRYRISADNACRVGVNASGGGAMTIYVMSKAPSTSSRCCMLTIDSRTQSHCLIISSDSSRTKSASDNHLSSHAVSAS
ncbi:hypothetical protein HBH98_181380 [Parastagonospora nodorum]|nr:hypothetical protein HBH51_172980 [Parastagonospora nodorum]KAH4074839.1 hypothetical protein HBH50_030490 [Parastagonospora nodorum]KAH4096899.1 hypothetical protein HBH48_039370 [Parastagonospora nodorum]KAH4120684.1 hypothetical protein HBH47_108690 [Parastagonospora nodorum]KAH4177196.1 hypothetical protein HBH43_049060 [Parastagonospora nodorum]